ncbi:2-amino-4-hydroxy-6-hydroxymethyldihydropteridine diphosphokinase [Vibrio sp. JC009]|uniref:2-amino-4-hydroxy-6- hydroxymethyldihydropteridine diphosphokinase n=1 Tax=Vibrio sp. JC009 TaxID=2912314 RepID=UPI0023B19634|nr:2-amino-4-hydroxy-6-hydroxymethyldihydropteridine diphosphokinase [Vibrio sp. JC009]WED21475.1 2-amino-4-hydroxy-6-hydroxymethyldihydropteridine diphosphokinase [Vibrio sp. JC009]
MTLVYVGAGTNIDREKHCRAAIEELSALDSDLRVSAIYECEAIGFDSNDFYNFVIELNTNLTLTDFSHYLRNIELKWGREANARKYQDRTLDLDIILFGDQISSESPVIPREDIYKYPFVTQPLYELAPDLVIPGTDTAIREIREQMEGLESLKTVDLKQ